MILKNKKFRIKIRINKSYNKCKIYIIIKNKIIRYSKAMEIIIELKNLKINYKIRAIQILFNKFNQKILPKIN